MINFKKKKLELKEKVEKLEFDRDTLKEELADVKLDKKISEEDIKHMIRMKEEKNEIEFERQCMVKDRECETQIAEVKDGYRDKMEANLKTQIDNIKEMYGEILQRLPDVNVNLKGKI